jgi:hypothetical protein
MKKHPLLLAAFLLLLTMACQKDDPEPQSDQRQKLMAAHWGMEEVTTQTDYTMTTSSGSLPVKQEQTRSGILSQCEYAVTFSFLPSSRIGLTYLPTFCGEQNPAAEDMRWSSNPGVTELTFTGENVAGMSMGMDGSLTSMGNEVTFQVLELTAQKLVITRTMPITDFFSPELMEQYEQLGVSFNGTYTYTTTYLAR